MMTPSKLTLREWKKPGAALELLEWPAHKGLAIVVDAAGRKQVLHFVLPGAMAKGVQGLLVLFPLALPTVITERPLLPPPCRSTKTEAENLIAKATEARSPQPASQARRSSDLPDGEVIWLQHWHEVLVPRPEDGEEFSKRLEPFIAKKREEYEARKLELEHWRTKTVGEMIYLGGGRFYRDLAMKQRRPMAERIAGQELILQSQFLAPLHYFADRAAAGCLNWTPEVARYEPVIRDPVLHERWAREHGLTLTGMQADKEAFMRWYQAHRPTTPVAAPSSSTDFLEVMCPGIRANAAERALCAEVRFVVEFGDGSRAWLADCPSREPLLTPGEQWPKAALVREAIASMTPSPASPGLDAALNKIQEVSEKAAARLTHAGDHVEVKAQAAARTLRRAKEDLDTTLRELETDQARLEQFMDQYKLRENPRTTRRALANHGVAERIADFIMEHLLAGTPIPKAPTAARALQNKYAKKEGLDRKTVDRHYRIATPILRAAGWPAHVLPLAESKGATDRGSSPERHQHRPPPRDPQITVEEIAQHDASETLSPVEQLQQGGRR
jgi:hypothetical protein